MNIRCKSQIIGGMTLYSSRYLIYLRLAGKGMENTVLLIICHVSPRVM